MGYEGTAPPEVEMGIKPQDLIVVEEKPEIVLRVDVFAELVKPDAFITHGVSGNFIPESVDNYHPENLMRIKTSEEVWSEMFANGFLIDPTSREGGWSEKEKYRYEKHFKGDEGRVYGYVSNMDVGLGGSFYLENGFVMVPAKQKDVEGMFVNPDKDDRVGSLTPIAMAKYDAQGQYQPVKIPLAESLVVMSPEMILRQIDNIETFCLAQNLEPEEWIRVHVIIADMASVEEESLLLEASERCKQSGKLVTTETELTKNAKGTATQLTREIVVGAREIKLEEASVEFTSAEKIKTPLAIQNRVEEYVRLAEDGYFENIGKNWFLSHAEDLARLTKVMKMFGMDEGVIYNHPKIMKYLEVVRKVVWDEEGWLDVEPTLTAIFPEITVGEGVKFAGVRYKKEESGWVRDKIPDYEEF